MSTSLQDSNLDPLRRKFLAAREFPVTPTPGRTFTLRLPTDHEMKMAGLRAGVHATEDAAAMVVLERALVSSSLVQWDGVVHSDLFKAESVPDAVPFSPGAVEVLLDAQPEWAAAFWQALLSRIVQRGQAEEEALKN